MRNWGKAAALAGAFFVVSSGAAFAEGYVGGVRGGVTGDVEFGNETYLAGGFAGYDFADDRSFLTGNWRLQGEFTFSSESEFIDVEFYTLTAAAYREFATGSFVRPYIVVGAGGTYVHIDGPFGDDSTQFFSLPVGGGLAFDLTENWSFDVDYRVNVFQGNADFSDVAETAELSGFIRYNFGIR